MMDDHMSTRAVDMHIDDSFNECSILISEKVDQVSIRCDAEEKHLDSVFVKEEDQIPMSSVKVERSVDSVSEIRDGKGDFIKTDCFDINECSVMDIGIDLKKEQHHSGVVNIQTETNMDCISCGSDEEQSVKSCACLCHNIRNTEIQSKVKIESQTDAIQDGTSGPVQPSNKQVVEHKGNNGKPEKSSSTSKKKNVCPVCNKVYIHASVLKNHLRTHTDEGAHDCSVCGYRANSKSQLQQHMFRHSGEKPFACTVCGKAFANVGNIKQHMFTHTGEKPYCCPTCGKCFTHPSHYKQHLGIHTGVKRHSCTVCEKQFVNKGDMKRHMLIHSGEKPHSCRVCDRRFVQSYQMKMHEETHFDPDDKNKRKYTVTEKVHTCSLCHKTFRRATHLRAHLLIHEKKKPHCCTVCDKAYAYANDLKKHMLSHSTNNPLACGVCGMAFTRDNYLKKHMKTHTA